MSDNWRNLPVFFIIKKIKMAKKTEFQQMRSIMAKLDYQLRKDAETAKKAKAKEKKNGKDGTSLDI